MRPVQCGAGIPQPVWPFLSLPSSCLLPMQAAGKGSAGHCLGALLAPVLPLMPSPDACGPRSWQATCWVSAWCWCLAAPIFMGLHLLSLCFLSAFCIFHCCQGVGWLLPWLEQPAEPSPGTEPCSDVFQSWLKHIQFLVYMLL